MYSERVIVANLNEFASREGWMPTYHTLEQVDEFKHYIDSIVKIESNSRSSYVTLTRTISEKRRKEVWHWVENEQALCGLDSNYFESRYAYVCNEKGQIYKFKNRLSQQIFDSVIADFDERQVSIELLVIKARQVGMCLSGDTRVLTAQLEWKRIDDLSIGEEIVAVDEGLTLEQRRAFYTKMAFERSQGVKHTRKKYRYNQERKMRTATIVSKWDTFQHAIRLTFEDGRVLTATPEHRFLIKQHGGSELHWQLTKYIGLNDEVRYITSPWDKTNIDDAWVAGALDGEGSLNTSKNGIEVKFSQVLNGVYNRFKQYVIDRKYNFQEGLDCRQPDPNRLSKLGKKDVGRISVARMDEVFRLIGQTRPVRFIGKRWWEGKGLPGKKSGIGWCKVVKVELLPPQRMIDIQTSTHTFIAEGFVSHNSTKTALKFIHKMLFIPHTQAVMASVQSDKSELIGRILNTVYNQCPWWLVPRATSKNSYENGSILSIQSGMQATGIAQGWTPTAIHVCLAPNTLIHIQNGDVKPIAEVLPGDLVVTSKNRLAKVKAVVRSPRVNEVACEIALWGNYSSLIVTRDHPLLTPEGFKPAEELGKGDFVRMPVRPITQKRKEVQIEWTPKGRRVQKREIESQKFNLDYGFGWFCGFYLAEGSIHYNARLADKPADAVYFSIHRKEKDYVLLGLRRVVGMFQHLHYHESKNSLTATYVLYDSGMTRWLMENFGKLAEGKKIPDWVFESGKDYIDGLLCGYYEGDGHICNDATTITCHSISMSLLIQIRDLLASRKYGWASLYFKPAGTYYGRNCHDQWSLNLNSLYANRFRTAMGWNTFERTDYKLDASDVRCKHAPKHWHYSADEKFIDIQIFNNKAAFSDSFFDLEVDTPEHSFCTVHCCVKNSELADIPKPKKVIEEGLLRATHSSRNLFLVFEGTGGGNTGWLADTWRASKEDWPKGRSRLCPIFIPWVMVPDLYPEDDWLRKFPIPGGWQPTDATRKHITRCELYVRNTSYLTKVVGKDWRMPIEQKWFWEFNYLQACKNHTQKIWLAQMAADDFEALTGVYDSVFDSDVIDQIEKYVYEIQPNGRAERKNPVQAYAITGDSIVKEFYPDESIIDYEKQHIRVSWTSDRGQRFFWTLVPLKTVDEEDENDTLDKLLVYEEPKPGCDYSCGIDTADGLGKEDEDRTCVSMTRNRFGDECDVQVCELTSNRINSAQIVGFAACLAAWYGERTKNPLGVKFCVEQISRPGDTCQHQLKLMGFHYHHKPRRYDSKKIKDDSGKKEGWFSNVWSVPILMTRFTEAVNGGWYRPSSRWLIEELKTLERHEAAGRASKMVHRSGYHDDRVRAAAQSYFTVHDMDVLADRAQRRYSPPTSLNPPLCRATCSLNAVAVGGWD